MRREVLRAAADAFGGDGIFNLACLSNAITDDAGTRGSIDGRVCVSMLRDRGDVEPLSGGSHFCFHDGAIARLRWWLSSAECMGDCGFRVRRHAHGRESAYCHVCMSRTPSRVGVRLDLALALLVVLGASGCGASALRTHATIATVASVAIAAAAPSVPAACDAALTTCRGEVACVTETAERCRVAARATDGLVAAVRGYVDAVEVASYADEGQALPALLAAWSGLVRLWPTVVAVLAAIGVTVPALPAVTP